MAPQDFDHNNRPADDHQIADAESAESHLSGYEDMIYAGGQDSSGSYEAAQTANSELFALQRTSGIGAQAPSAFSSTDVSLLSAGGPWDTARITQNTIYGGSEVIEASLDQEDKYAELSKLLLEAGYEGELSDEDMVMLIEELKKVEPDIQDGKADTIKLIEEIKRMQLEATIRSVKIHDSIENISDYETRATAIDEMYLQLNGASPALARMTEITFKQLFEEELKHTNKSGETETYSVREYIEQKLTNDAFYDRGDFKELFASGTLSKEDVETEAKLATGLFDGFTKPRQELAAKLIAENLQAIQPGNSLGHNLTTAGVAGLFAFISTRMTLKVTDDGIPLKGSFAKGQAPIYMGVFAGGLANDGMHRLNREDYRALERNLLGLRRDKDNPANDQIAQIAKLVGEEDLIKRTNETFHSKNLDKLIDEKKGIKALPKEHTSLTNEEQVAQRAEEVIAALTTEGIVTDPKTIDEITKRAEQDELSLSRSQELLMTLSDEDRKKVLSEIEEKLKTEPVEIHEKDENGELVLVDGKPKIKEVTYVVPEGSPANYEALVRRRYDDSKEVGTFVLEATTKAFNPELVAQELLMRAKTHQVFYKPAEGEQHSQEKGNDGLTAQQRLEKVFHAKLSLLTRDQAKATIEAYDKLMGRDIDLGEGIIEGVDHENNTRLVRLYQFGSDNIIDQLSPQIIYNSDIADLIVSTNASTGVLPEDSLEAEELRKKIEALPSPIEDLKRVFAEQLNEDPSALLEELRGASDEELRIYKTMLKNQFGEEGMRALERTLETSDSRQFHSSSDLGLNGWQRTEELHAIITNDQGLPLEEQKKRVREILEAAYTTTTEGTQRSLEEQKRAAEFIRDIYQERHGSELRTFLQANAPELLYFSKAVEIKQGIDEGIETLGDTVQTLALTTPEEAKYIEASFEHYFPEAGSLKHNLIKAQKQFALSLDYQGSSSELGIRGKQVMAAIDHLDGNDPLLAAETLKLVMYSKAKDLSNASGNEIDLRELREQEAAFVYHVLSRGEQQGVTDTTTYKKKTLEAFGEDPPLAAILSSHEIAVEHQALIMTTAYSGDLKEAIHATESYQELNRELRAQYAESFGFDRMNIRGAQAFEALITTPEADFDDAEYHNMIVYLEVIAEAQIADIPEAYNAMYGLDPSNDVFETHVNEFIEMERTRQKLHNANPTAEAPYLSSERSEALIQRLQEMTKPKEERKLSYKAPEQYIDSQEQLASAA